MNTQELIQNIANFCKEETPRLIAELQKKRFENQGAFNDNKKWDDNDPYIDHEATKIGGKLYPNKGVQQDKGRNEPLVDSGNLKSSLTNPSNWDLKPRLGKGKLTLSIPEEEGFTDSKYDKLQSL